MDPSGRLEQEKRFHRLLGQLMELPSEARASFLDRHCAGDPVLRTRLEGTLALEDDAVEDFLEQPRPISRLAATLSPSDPLLAITDHLSGPVPRIVDHYVLHEILGEGGMGRVFRAEQMRPERRTVALKLMRSSVKTPQTRRRFDIERRTLERLEHPHIGRLLGSGTTEDDYPYFVMELLETQPVTVYSDRHRLGLEARIELLEGAARGVEHAHRHRVLHRDLKPSNLLVVEEDGHPVSKVIDFGIAVVTGEGPDDAIAIRGLTGTPAYMSPESLDGHAELDERSDIYALGVVLYELLVGEPPFGAPGLDRTDAVLRIVKGDAPEPPSRRAAGFEPRRLREVAARRGLAPDELPRRLENFDALVLEAIAKDPAERYPSAAAFADALAGVRPPSSGADS